MSKNLILYAAINGSRYQRESSNFAPLGVPFIPYTVEEALDNVKHCYEAGVRLVHVHSRSDSGEHKTDPKWYQTFSQVLRSQYPDVKFCFATSRSGEVMQQIKAKYISLVGNMPEKDARVESEMIRTACLKANNGESLPHLLTAFTATEVRMHDESADIGHVTDSQSSTIVREFFERLTTQANAKNVCHEIEITTKNSIDIVENLQEKIKFSKPISIIILPGFTKDFQFESAFLDKVIKKARNIIERNFGKGFVTLGRILNPLAANIESKRIETIEYAVNNPDINAIRIGIEDGPYWDKEPSTNAELATKTLSHIKKSGGDIITDVNKINDIIGF